MPVNNFATYEAARKRFAARVHSPTEEALVSTWEAGAKLFEANQRLLADTERLKAELETSQAKVGALSHRLECYTSRGQPSMSLNDMLAPARRVLKSQG